MFFPFVLLAVSLLRYIYNQEMVPAEVEFPGDLMDWCPYTSFCQKEAAEQSPSTFQTNGDDEFKPCCESCSCAKDCGLTKNCCRPEFDQHMIDEELGTTCKALTNKKRNTVASNHYYNIVDQCPNEEEPCSSMYISQSGSFSPVYSRSTGLIYYNTYCASCHNQTDIVEFTPVISCQFLSGTYAKLFTNGLSGLDEETYMEYLIPEGIDISSERCYPFIVRTCTNEKTDLYRLKDLCASFNATFHDGVFTYQNVYCYLCRRYQLDTKQKWMEKHTMCPISQRKKGLLESPLLVLLDSDWIEEYTAAMSDPFGIKHVCFDIENTDLQTCRPVHCPEGKVRVHGICTLFGERWYVKKARVLMNLTIANPNERLLVSDLLQIPSVQLASPRKAFVRRPAMFDWNMDLFYNVHENETTVRYMVAIMSMQSGTIRPMLVLEDIQKSLESTWSIDINGTAIDLHAKFNNYINYISSRDNQEHNGLSHWVPRVDYELNGDSDRITKLFHFDVSLFQGDNALCITKLFFCDLVDLQQNEFTMLGVNQGAVYLINERRRLGSGEFTVSTPGKVPSKPYEIRVCVSDVLRSSAIVTDDNVMTLLMLVGLVLFSTRFN